MLDTAQIRKMMLGVLEHMDKMEADILPTPYSPYMYSIYTIHPDYDTIKSLAALTRGTGRIIIKSRLPEQDCEVLLKLYLRIHDYELSDINFTDPYAYEYIDSYIETWANVYLSKMDPLDDPEDDEGAAHYNAAINALIDAKKAEWATCDAHVWYHFLRDVVPNSSMIRSSKHTDRAPTIQTPHITIADLIGLLQ
jgi:hypothetical protein